MKNYNFIYHLKSNNYHIKYIINCVEKYEIIKYTNNLIFYGKE